jgi:hypothetical protein
MYYPTPEEFAHDIELLEKMIVRHETDLRRLKDNWGSGSTQKLGEEHIKALHLTIHKLEESLETISKVCAELKELYRQIYGAEYRSGQNKEPTFH